MINFASKSISKSTLAQLDHVHSRHYQNSTTMVQNTFPCCTCVMMTSTGSWAVANRGLLSFTLVTFTKSDTWQEHTVRKLVAVVLQTYLVMITTILMLLGVKATGVLTPINSTLLVAKRRVLLKTTLDKIYF